MLVEVETKIVKLAEYIADPEEEEEEVVPKDVAGEIAGARVD